MFVCYRDLWKMKSEKQNALRQGIIQSDRCTENCIKLRTNNKGNSHSNARNNAIAIAYRDKFIIPLEILDSMMLYYQLGPGNRLCYELQ